MALDNPAFSRNEAFSKQGAVATAQDMSAQDLQQLFDQPATLNDREVMTVENTLAKTLGAFAVLVVFAAIGCAASKKRNVTSSPSSRKYPASCAM